MRELVSILIPAYNAAPWIARAITSAINQSWWPVEVIVVDDGSHDRTLDVCRDFESRQVKVVSQPNMGAAAARNEALRHAQGRFVQWLDADDVYHPEKTARQLHAARELGNPMWLISGAFGRFNYRPEKSAFTRTALWRDLTPIDYLLTGFNQNVWFQKGVWLMSRELLDVVGPWPETRSPGNDREYVCHMVARSAGIKFVEDARTYHRASDLGRPAITRSATALNALFASKARSIQSLLSLEDSSRTRAAGVQLLQHWYQMFYPESEHIVEQAQRLAEQLGGTLQQPRLTWQYRPVEWLWGYPSAVTLSRDLPLMKARLVRDWDKWVHSLSSAHSEMAR